MADWALRTEGNSVNILKQGITDPCMDEKSVYADSNITLHLLYYQPFRSQPKLLGYRLVSKTAPPHLPFTTLLAPFMTRI